MIGRQPTYCSCSVVFHTESKITYVSKLRCIIEALLLAELLPHYCQRPESKRDARPSVVGLTGGVRWYGWISITAFLLLTVV